MSGDERVINDVERMINRERVLIEGARAMHRSTQNQTVREQCDANIRESERNILYLRSRLEALTLKEASQTPNKTKKPGTYATLDLLRYDNPHMGPRIQLMLQQLEFKLSIEQQYKAGSQRLQKLYGRDGDRRNQAEADANLSESNAKIALLKRALKRYSDVHLSAIEADEELRSRPNARRPLTGTLHLSILQISDVDHTSSSAWNLATETYVSLKAENQVIVPCARPNPNSTLDVPLDRVSEIELLVYDSSQDGKTPVALQWMHIADIVESLRHKRVEQQAGEGWANAETVKHRQSMPHQVPASAAPSSMYPSNNQDATSSSLKSLGHRSVTEPVIEDWFILEPAGRIKLRVAFDKTTKGFKRHTETTTGGLGRHNAIRKHDEVQEVRGHELVHLQSYNIMRCAVCGEFMTYPHQFQCSECKFACHKKCVPKVATACLVHLQTESQASEEQLNHRIPHRFEPSSKMSANWCCHCGSILPLGKKHVRRCAECNLVCHASCVRYVPDLCGMSMEMAMQFLNEIKSTRIRQATKAASRTARSISPSTRVRRPAKSPSRTVSPSSQTGKAAATAAYRPYTSGKLTHNLHAPRPRNEPIKRKQVPSQSSVSVTPSPTSANSYRVDRDSEQESLDPSRPHQTAPQVEGTPRDIRIPDRRAWWSDTQSADTERSPEEAAAALQSAPVVATGPLDKDIAHLTAEPITPTGGRRSEEATSPGQPKSHYKSSPPTIFHTKTEDQTVEPSQARPQSGAPKSPKSPRVVSAEAANAAAMAMKLSASLQQSERPVSAGMRASIEKSAEQARRRRQKVSLDDFSFLAVLGKGNFGKVMLAESKQLRKLYAIKVLKKNFIIENHEVESVCSEKRVFLIANRERHPFLINLFACFQTENRIYFVMDYVSGGDLMYHIQKELFTPARAQFYAAEVLLALKHFHDNDVIYRDIKLDNILLTPTGHIKLADYGLCKEGMGYGKTTGTFCGTPDFIAPEILLDQKYGRSVDWWAFGVLMYQMLLGKSPFHSKDEDEDEVYDAILSDEPLYPIHMPRDSVSILQQLLTRDPARRLGCGPRDALEIMEHPYFQNINFDDLRNLRVEVPYKPQIDSPTDVKYFDREFTSEMPALTQMNATLDASMQQHFRGFSYMGFDAI